MQENSENTNADHRTAWKVTVLLQRLREGVATWYSINKVSSTEVVTGLFDQLSISITKLFSQFDLVIKVNTFLNVYLIILNYRHHCIIAITASSSTSLHHRCHCIITMTAASPSLLHHHHHCIVVDITALSLSLHYHNQHCIIIITATLPSSLHHRGHHCIIVVTV